MKYLVSILMLSLSLPTLGQTIAQPAQETTLKAINTKVPASPAQDRTTAAAPESVRLSDGSGFYVPLTDTALRASAVPVSFSSLPTGTNNIGSVTLANASLAVTGTFWQTTQPVSFGALPTGTNNIGSVTLANASLPVTGTFWQATQPVSGPLTDTQLRATAVPVSGTFWQSTQPVSGTFWQATQPVSIAATLNTSAAQSGTWTVQPGNTANTTAWLVTGATLTKGTQGSTGFATQDLKDSGRTNVILYAENVGGVASEGSITLSQSKAFAAVTTGTSYTVTTGKTLRLTSLTASWNSSTTTLSASQIKLRVNTGGAMALGSPIVHTMRVGFPSATVAANEVSTFTTQFPDGIEIPAASGVGVTHIETAANGTLTISISGFEY